MAETGSLREPQKVLLSESDMAAAAVVAVAAEQLMQLSDEDNSSSDVEKKKKKKKKSLDKEEEEDYVQSKDEVTWAKKIEEIFGKEEGEEEIYRQKKRRYRTLVSLYKETKPMPLDIHRKKLRY